MSKNIIHYTLLLTVMVLAQTIIFNHLCLFNVAIPLVFIYFIISLPASLKVNWVLTLSFITGLIIDIFSDTMGMNALSCTCLGLLRHPVLKLYIQRDTDLGDREPAISTIGASTYLKYSSTLTLIYCSLYFVIEAMTFSSVTLMLMRIMASTALTELLIIAINSFSRKA